MLLEGGFALEQPARELEQAGRMVAGESEGGVDEGVGFDEGAVEVDAERWERNGSELVDGKQGCRQWSGPSIVIRHLRMGSTHDEGIQTRQIDLFEIGLLLV